MPYETACASLKSGALAGLYRIKPVIEFSVTCRMISDSICNLSICQSSNLPMVNL